MQGLRVLLVDDEEDFTDVLSMRLETRGINVDVSSNGMDALEKAKKKQYDAVILDLAMPEMDGIETLKHLLRGNPALQVILLTGHASLEKGIEAVRTGAMEFLEKPADIDMLLKKINEAFTRKTELTENLIEESLSRILKKKGW